MIFFFRGENHARFVFLRAWLVFFGGPFLASKKNTAVSTGSSSRSAVQATKSLMKRNEELELSDGTWECHILSCERQVPISCGSGWRMLAI